MGKSVTISFLIDALSGLGIDPEKDVCFCAPTGKAATLLAKKNNPNCMTLHKLLYQARLMPNGKYKFEPKSELEYKIIVVDEVSMVGQSMINQLLAHNNIYVIFCGDPFQLEVINKEDKSDILEHPHVFLDEVLRQAKESSIIRLSMDVREGRRLQNYKDNEIQVLSKHEFIPGMLTWSDITLCSKNKTRIQLNQQTRELLGYTQPIEDGEKIIFLRNYWDIISDKGFALTNGVIGNLSDWSEDVIIIPDKKNRTDISIPVIVGHFDSDNNEDYGTVILDKNCLINGTPILSEQQKYDLRKYRDLFPLEATYGNCATCWKFQGDQAPKVLLIEEAYPFGLEHQKYIYTGITRSQEKLVLIRQY